MLITLVLWVVISFECLLSGLLLVRCFSKLFGKDDSDKTNLIVVMLTGIGVVGTLSSYVSIFFKIGLLINLLVLIVLVIYMIIDKIWIRSFLDDFKASCKNLHPIVIFSWFILLLVILAETSWYYPKNYDTALYHAQAIHWIENYPAIPGLGNLHKRFAYNSEWFLPSAFYSFSFIAKRSFHVLNGWILLAGASLFLFSINSLIRKKYEMSDVLNAILLPLSVFINLNFLSSPGTDTPAIVIIWVLFYLFLKEAENKKAGSFGMDTLAVFTLSAFLISIKLSGLPILLMSCFFFIRMILSGKIREAVLMVLLSIIVILPWFIRNIILSGYIIYPYQGMDFLGVDWKIPADILNGDVKGIQEWASRIPAGMPIGKYLWQWLLNMKIQYQLFIFPLLAGILVSYIVVLYKIWEYRNRLKELWLKVRDFALIYFTAYAAVFFFFYTAPDVRYGSGFLVVFGLLHIVPMFVPFFRKGIKGIDAILKRYVLLVSVFMIFIEGVLFYRYFFYQRVHGEPMMYQQEKVSVILDRIFMPADYFRPDQENMKTILIGQSFKVFIPAKSDMCWYEPFPSIPVMQDEALKLRGKRVEDGFRIERK